jgi:regulator of nonsense transcripts 1
VALTRAKFGVIIIGNAKVLSRNELWHRLIKEYQDQGLLVEGSLNSLRRNEMHLSKPNKMKRNVPGSNSLIPRATFSAKEMMMGPPREPYHMTDTHMNFNDDYYRTHDHMGYIGVDRNAVLAGATMHLPHSLFIPPPPTPQHYQVMLKSIHFILRK